MDGEEEMIHPISPVILTIQNYTTLYYTKVYIFITRTSWLWSMIIYDVTRLHWIMPSSEASYKQPLVKLALGYG